ncbi:hypothetical protein BDF20DRAFT_849393 [Mycotypha africana]|uniref:uncharacterized protein n=1 Tax=Mycotypha africana TaxID=64632 RepID=UPI00230067C6|nr:uncharacterized protein BDF20DRAFT_849393 [Mycotypha africana]KAI8987314.1 hypothetical protein BDF20DRAFT_849393 [Mycotypha africana]
MPRPLSDSWQYFELLPPDNGRSRKARCTFCGHEQAAGITRLHQHLLYRCSRIPADIRDQLRQKQEDRNRDASPPHNSHNNNNNGRNDISLPSRQENRHVQFQPSQTVQYHFDPTLQNTLSSSNTSAIIANSSSNSNSSKNHHHLSTNSADHTTATTSISPYYEAALTGTPATASQNNNFSTTTTSFAFSPSPATPQQALEQPRILQQQHSVLSSSSTSQAQTPQDENSQALLDWHLARALFSANIPFEAVENPYVIDFLRHLQPNYVVPRGKRLKQYLLKEQHWDLISWEEATAAATVTRSVNDIHASDSSRSGSNNFTARFPSSNDWGSPVLNQAPRQGSSASSPMGRIMMTNANSTSNPTMDDRILSSMHPTTSIKNQQMTSALSTS